ncbi:error-prone DNA polymerase [Lacipirellula parvula]|uniref:Error-prone DNA polymerase n=1 Tax=Lacipirellula parvula TaxID=2650471 RepID=A0A5K7XKV6_9BACT|nr:error-prone DNA polymerase [Lacipirellula parvula]BBO35166.1 error-prone repair DNA polymerase subunit [Lacipirellula parvula]
MPDSQPDKRQPIEPRWHACSEIPYAELHCKTNFSFLEGASHADELVSRASELGYRSLAITDRNSLAGVVRAHGVAKQIGFKLLIGAELTPSDSPAVVTLATDRAAYGRLCRLLTLGRRRAPKGECRLTFDNVAEHAEGIIVCIVGDTSLEHIRSYQEVFGNRCYLLAELHRGADDQRVLAERVRLAKQAKVPLAAANDVHFHASGRRALADVLTATKHGCTVATAGDLLFPNAVRHLKTPEELRELFATAPRALQRTIEIADRCTFSLDELRYDYPKELAPHGMTPCEHLFRLTWEGARGRYPNGVPDKVHQQIEHELQLIQELRYEAYFLTAWDLVRFARSKDILCQGRGSAANSAVCYCLGVTSVDPEQMEVLFERFISRERDEAPDIDVDFEHERREEVIQYVYQKYGRDRAAMTAEVITYRPRSAIRDVAKALGFSLDAIDAISKSLDPYVALDSKRCEAAGVDLKSLAGKQLLALTNELVGFPRHLGQHVGGMVITDSPLCELVPIENAAMEDRTVIEWDKNDLDELGFLKVDCLSLGMLTAIRKCFEFVQKHHGRELTLTSIPQEDRDVYEMMHRADTMGVFQIESRAQMSMLPRLKPVCFYDLVIEVAIVRPGPIQGNMVHPYLQRRATGEVPTYPNDAIRGVLQRTLGIPLFQEQAMQLAVVAAQFTPGEADQLRRAMAAWRRPGVINEFRIRLLRGMQANGLSAEFAESVYRQIQGFGEYGFPESHAASFARLVYISAYLKFHYPAAFCAALINSQPMGFYAPAQLVRNAQAHGVTVLPVDVNRSVWNCTLEDVSLRLGLRMIVGMPKEDAALIEVHQPFGSMDEVRRGGISQRAIERLARADAFGSLQMNRRTSLWQSLRPASTAPLFQAVEDSEEEVLLPAMEGTDEVFADYDATGLSLKAHPVSFLRSRLDEFRVVPAARLPKLLDGCQVKVGGLVLVRQRPGTAKGITFVTLEDETGVANLIIRKDVWERFQHVARAAPAYIASGRLQNQQGVVHVLVSRLENLHERITHLRSKSRDFH